MSTVILTPGTPFTPERCRLCGSKNPPHPAHLTIERDGGASRLAICVRCDEAMSALAKLIGTQPAAFRVDQGAGPDTYQAEMPLDGEEPEPEPEGTFRDLDEADEASTSVVEVPHRVRRSRLQGSSLKRKGAVKSLPAPAMEGTA